ncbi:MAG: AAA family ATPase [Prevotella sp.]|nr:AAA family ATPase [Prevotella sp.]
MDDIILRNLFKNVNLTFLNDAQKVLTFYKLAIELERMKEPDIREYYEYPINYHANPRIMLVDFPCNEEFNKLFEKNRNRVETKFPSDLYVGLKIKIGDDTYRLLNMVIDFNDIKTIHIEEELLPIRISDFEVNLKEASRLELLPDKIDSINEGIKANPTWQGIMESLRKELSDDVTVSDNLFLALSSKSIELSQIYSELNSKHLQVTGHSLLESFLLNEPINNAIENVDVDSLLCVTKLDDSQKKAIAEALGARISVITGAPGTGKTQVIENLLANALMRGKKVLVASKNNKAVDNVKDRFDVIDPSGYFLRFGSRQVVSTSTLPAIERIITEIGRLEDNTDKYNSLIRQYKNAVSSIQQGKQQIFRITQLQQELSNLATQKTTAQHTLQQIEPEHITRVANIKQKHESMLPMADCSVDELNKCLSAIKTLDNNLTAKFTGFFGFWHRAFSVKKNAALLLNEVERFPFAVKSYSSKSQYELCSEMSDFKSHEVLFGQIRKWKDLVNKGLKLKQELCSEDNRYVREKRNAEQALSQIENEEQQKTNELNALNNSLPTIQSSIEGGKRWIRENSLNMVAAFIHHNKKKEGAVRSITAYKNYLPAQIPWKDDEYIRFTQQAKAFLDAFTLCSVTSLSTKNAFPLTSELFDMVIIDEASQCDIASALPLIMRTKQLVVIGDPMQLRHISAVKIEEEQAIKQKLGLANRQYVKYAECSLYDYCKDYISNVTAGLSTPYMLNYHYRCFPSIIGYSNDMFYGGVMGQRLEVKTDVSRLKGNPQGIVLVNVVGRQVNDNVNINEAEAKKAIELAVQAAQSYPDVSIGIVTPFRHQAEKINSMIPANYADRIEANTVHKYQGDEKDIMIYSLVVTSNSPDRKIYWIDNSVPNLVNVAVTRAKSTLYVVGNLDYIKAHSNANKPLGYLVRYNN